MEKFRALLIGVPFLLITLSGGYLAIKGPPRNHPSTPEKPHVFVIMVDDMGVNDVSYRGSNQYFTPNIDALAYNGIILQNYYVPAMCTPSRSALMTGKYPTSTGMHHFVIDSDEPWGLGLEEKILPEYFKEAGYSTSMFGKWHLGYFRRAYLPNARGFDHFFGYRGPYIDYYQHELHKLDRNYSHGFDMWENNRPSYETLGKYATNLLTDKAIEYVNNYDLKQKKPMFMYFSHLAPHTANEDDPMQAPPEVIARFNYIEDPKRRVMAAMMTVLDEQIGKFVSALDKKGILKNSVILFYSDNGAPTVGLHANTGSNFPLKGQKNSPWEGAIRSAGIIWSPLLSKTGRVSKQVVHSSDWLPTLLSVAGVEIPASVGPIDGVNVWDSLSEDTPSPRVEVVHNIDSIYPYTSYMLGSWKYVNGTINPALDTWLGDIPENDNPKAEKYLQEVYGSPAWKAVSRHCKNSKIQRPEETLKLRKSAMIECPQQTQSGPEWECNPKISPCLFDIENDPCERINLATVRPEVLKVIEEYVLLAKKGVVAPRNQPLDIRSDPGTVLNNGTWTYWLDLVEENESVVE